MDFDDFRWMLTVFNRFDIDFDNFKLIFAMFNIFLFFCDFDFCDVQWFPEVFADFADSRIRTPVGLDRFESSKSLFQ